MIASKGVVRAVRAVRAALGGKPPSSVEGKRPTERISENTDDRVSLSSSKYRVVNNSDGTVTVYNADGTKNTKVTDASNAYLTAKRNAAESIDRVFDDFLKTLDGLEGTRDLAEKYRSGKISEDELLSELEARKRDGRISNEEAEKINAAINAGNQTLSKANYDETIAYFDMADSMGINTARGREIASELYRYTSGSMSAVTGRLEDLKHQLWAEKAIINDQMIAISKDMERIAQKQVDKMTKELERQKKAQILSALGQAFGSLASFFPPLAAVAPIFNLASAFV